MLNPRLMHLAEDAGHFEGDVDKSSDRDGLTIISQLVESRAFETWAYDDYPSIHLNRCYRKNGPGNIGGLEQGQLMLQSRTALLIERYLEFLEHDGEIVVFPRSFEDAYRRAFNEQSTVLVAWNPEQNQSFGNTRLFSGLEKKSSSSKKISPGNYDIGRWGAKSRPAGRTGSESTRHL